MALDYDALLLYKGQMTNTDFGDSPYLETAGIQTLIRLKAFTAFSCKERGKMAVAGNLLVRKIHPDCLQSNKKINNYTG